jgi:hypothetical protein
VARCQLATPRVPRRPVERGFREWARTAVDFSRPTADRRRPKLTVGQPSERAPSILGPATGAGPAGADPAGSSWRAQTARAHPRSAEASRTPPIAASGSSLSAGVLRRSATTARSSGTITHVREQERPFVVVSGAVINPNRRFLALARDTHDAAARLTLADLTKPSADEPSGRLGHRSTTSALRRLRKTGRQPASPATTLLASARLASARLLLLTWCRRNTGTDRDQLKVAVRDRILVLLAKETLLHEDVDVRRKVSRPHLPLIEVYRARVLLAAEDELRLLLPLHLMAPDRHRHRHQEHHDSDAHQQRSHRISALTALTL